MKSPPPLEIYYDTRQKNYWIRIGPAKFLNLDSRDVKQHLMLNGQDIHYEDEHGLKTGDRILIKAQLERAVDYAGPLSGHKAGMFTLPDGAMVLVTSERNPIKPKAGEIPHFTKYFAELLGSIQTTYLLCWLKCALETLERGDFRPGQMVVLAGDGGCGKSLMQWLITRLLGGRQAKPYGYITGKTDFNADLVQAEHLFIEDESGNIAITSRRLFGAGIKQMVANESTRIHAKGKQASLIVPLCTRLSITLNSEAENVMALPPMDESLKDKMMLFKCGRATLNPDKSKNVANFVPEMPALVAGLKAMRIPKAMQCGRYGVTHYHHPDILEILDEASPENRLLNLIKQVIFRPGKEHPVTIWEGTSMELEKELRSYDGGFQFAVEKLLNFSSACGVYLARLASKHPQQFSKLKNVWTILPTP